MGGCVERVNNNTVPQRCLDLLHVSLAREVVWVALGDWAKYEIDRMVAVGAGMH